MKREKWAAWVADLPPASQAALARDDREGRQEAKQAEMERQQREAAAENLATAYRMAGREPQTVSEVLAARGELADRQADHDDFRARRQAGLVDLVEPVHRSKAPADPDGVIGRAMLAAAERQREASEQAGEDLLARAAATRRPASWGEAWTGWRRNHHGD